MNELMLAMFGLPGGAEWIIIGLVALLLFGRRLPDVARSLGKSIVEFKRGIREVENDADSQARLEGGSSTKPHASTESADKSSKEQHSEVL